jgi:hypothetical protein
MPTDGTESIEDRVRGYRGDDDSVVPDLISSTSTEHRWKHITLTLAALDVGPIAMIAGLGWLLGTQQSANIMNGAARAIDRDNLEHGSNADHVHEQDLLLVTDASLVTVIIGLAASLILIVIGSFFKKRIQL